MSPDWYWFECFECVHAWPTSSFEPTWSGNTLLCKTSIHGIHDKKSVTNRTEPPIFSERWATSSCGPRGCAGPKYKISIGFFSLLQRMAFPTMQWCSPISVISNEHAQLPKQVPNFESLCSETASKFDEHHMSFKHTDHLGLVQSLPSLPLKSGWYFCFCRGLLSVFFLLRALWRSQHHHSIGRIAGTKLSGQRFHFNYQTDFIPSSLHPATLLLYVHRSCRYLEHTGSRQESPPSKLCSTVCLRVKVGLCKVNSPKSSQVQSKAHSILSLDTLLVNHLQNV